MFEIILMLIGTVLTTSVAMGGMFAWFWKRLDKKFEAIDKRFDKIDEAIAAMRTDIRMLDTRMSRLEGQDEERFRNEVRMIAGKH